MQLLWMNLIVFSSIYLISSILFFLRSSHQCINSRSPTIIQICHWANLSEILFTSVIIMQALPKNAPSQYWALESMMNLSHFLMVFCYLLRAYRLYFIFNLDAFKDSENSSFYVKRHRISQRWMVITLMAMISPFVLIALSVLLIIVFYQDPGLYVKNNYGERTTAHYMIEAFFEFLLEFSLIMFMYVLRFVENEFQMSKELISVTFFLCITPMFSIFVHENRNWLFAYIVRNLVIMLITTVGPVILSYFQKETIQTLSTDLLQSLQLIIQHPVTLNTFEKFLKSYKSGKGCIYLDVFLSCELFFNMPAAHIGENIIKKAKILDSEIPSFSPDCISTCDPISLQPLYNHCASVLEQEYFTQFTYSTYYEELRSFIYRQEIFNNRISATSFGRGGAMGKSTSMVKLITFFES